VEGQDAAQQGVAQDAVTAADANLAAGDADGAIRILLKGMATLVVVGVLALTLAVAAHAQRTTGTILGQVTDSTGAVLSGATVTITNEGTNAVKTAVTDAEGHFTIAFVPVGSYTVNVSLDGFKTHTETHRSVTSGENVTVSYALAEMPKAPGPVEPDGAALLRLGVERESHGELTAALEAYMAAAGKLEGEAKAEALGRAAVIQFTRGEADASSTLEAAEAADPGGIWPTIAMAYRALNAGQASEAVTLSRKAIDAGGGANAQTALGHALHAQGDASGAEEAYRAAMAADDTLPGPAIGLARVLRTSGRAEEAEPLLTQVIGASPDAVEAYKEMARVKIALDRIPEALGDALMVARLTGKEADDEPLVLEVKVARALQDLRSGNAALAEQDLTQLSKEHPESVEVHFGLARAQLERRDADAAIVELQKVVELDPDNAEAHYELGRVELKLKADPSAAVPPLEKAAELEPGNATYLTTLGTALVNAQRFDQAVEVLTKATETPDYSDAGGLLSLGQAYVNLKRYREAVPVLEKAASLAPDAAPIWATLGWAHFGLKDAESFKQAAGKARSLGYNEPTLLQYLSRVEGGEEIK
jgi:tetratricopeptide (TPR) repeat protein